MEFEEQVVDSLAQWEMNWTTVTIQSKGSIIKKHPLKQWWTYMRIRHISKKCYRTLGSSTDPNALMEKMENDALTLLELILGVDRSDCMDLIQSTYADATKKFVDEAREFDPDLEAESIFQALRNVWIMHSIQVLHGMEPKHSASIFGYSMLYPLTDNYLDDKSISSREKVEFNTLFRRRLEGEAITVESRQLKDVFSMIERMESDYPRSEFPDVWNSILLIQSAQENSLRQQRQFTTIESNEITALSFRKGGASVLADGYLVCGGLSPKWIHFLLGYGILLQLADDLQDLYTDAEDEHWTLFSILHKNKEVHNQVQKLRNFSEKFLKVFLKTI